MNREAVFFDRDGVITKQFDAPIDPNFLSLNEKVIPLLQASHKLGYLNIVVSNQPNMALGRVNPKRNTALAKKFDNLIHNQNLPIDGTYYCFHHPQGQVLEYTQDCDCRKPKPGMILKAAAEHDIDLKRSYLVGDRASDIKAGADAGTRTILFDQNGTQNPYLEENGIQPHHRVESLDEITPILFKENQPHIQAMILAAGKGDRMLPLTIDLPKPLLPIAGKPMAEYIIDLLASHGFSNIGINLQHYGNKISDYFGDGNKFGVNITYAKEDELSGTAGGVKKIAEILQPKKPFFVISSDMMVNFDLSAAYLFHLTHGGIATLCCYPRPKKQLVAGKSGVVSYHPQTRLVERFVERPTTEAEIISQWVNSSIYIFDPEVLDYIPDEINGQRIIDLPRHIFPYLLAAEEMYAFPVDPDHYYQLGVDTPERITQFEEDLRKGRFVPKYRLT